jgi:hypothetical protein
MTPSQRLGKIESNGGLRSGGGGTFLAIEAMFVSELTTVRDPLLNRPSKKQQTIACIM